MAPTVPTTGLVLILDPDGSKALKQWQLPSTPVYMAITGSKDIEYRIVCACRDGNVHTIKENGPSGIVIELESMPVVCAMVHEHVSRSSSSLMSSLSSSASAPLMRPPPAPTRRPPLAALDGLGPQQLAL